MRSLDREAPARAELTRSRCAALLLALPLFLGLLIEVDGPRATLLGFEGPICQVGEWIGPAGCPGCGLTRSTALVMHGQPAAAIALNATGLVLVLLCVAGLVLHLDVLLRTGRRNRSHELLATWGTRGFAAALFFTWLIRLI